jgi:hypothetical protein
VTERVLSTQQLNRALLARQLLLDRSKLPITRAPERVGGLQTQYAPSGYIGLWSRLHDFRRDALTKVRSYSEFLSGLPTEWSSRRSWRYPTTTRARALTAELRPSAESPAGFTQPPPKLEDLAWLKLRESAPRPARRAEL